MRRKYLLTVKLLQVPAHSMQAQIGALTGEGRRDKPDVVELRPSLG